jgi:hypothetical protein
MALVAGAIRLVGDWSPARPGPPDSGAPGSGPPPVAVTGDSGAAAPVVETEDRAARPADSGAGLAEEKLMALLRREVDPQPEVALGLAWQAEQRFPRGRRADERAWLKMRALVHLGRIAEARDEAARFFKRHPRSRYAGRVHRLTGMHPRPRPGPR